MSRSFYFSIFLFLICLQSNSQIIYTDITDTILTFPPQTTGILDDSTSFFYFDLDQDGLDDFYFSAHYWEEWYSPSASEYPHWVINLSSVSASGIPWEEACAIDFTHGDTIQWYQWASDAALYVNVLGYSTVCNLPFQDRYFGLKLQTGSGDHYGWIRLDATTDTLKFKDFAFNSDPNGIIRAGQTNTMGEAENIPVDDPLCFDGKKLHFLNAINTYLTYTVLNTAGQTIDRSGIQNRGSIDLSHLRPGFYIVILEGKNSVKAIKVILR